MFTKAVFRALFLFSFSSCHVLYLLQTSRNRSSWVTTSSHPDNTFSQCLLSVSIRTCSPNREVKMSSLHWPVSLWVKKMRLGSSLHMVSLHIYCLKNATLEAHYIWPASINIASKTRLWKLIMHGQLLYICDDHTWGLASALWLSELFTCSTQILQPPSIL